MQRSIIDNWPKKCKNCAIQEKNAEESRFNVLFWGPQMKSRVGSILEKYKAFCVFVEKAGYPRVIVG